MVQRVYLRGTTITSTGISQGVQTQQHREKPRDTILEEIQGKQYGSSDGWWITRRDRAR